MIPPAFQDILHELSEGLQSTGSYLSVARRISGYTTSGHAATADMIAKAADELVRVQTAFHQLRAYLIAEDRYFRGVGDLEVQAGPSKPSMARQIPVADGEVRKEIGDA